MIKTASFSARCKRVSGPILFAGLLFLSNCGFSHFQEDRQFVQQHRLMTPQNEIFQICYAYGCKRRVDVRFSPSDWKRIQNKFKPLPLTATQERHCMARAVQEFEILIGERTGIDSDLAGSFSGLFKENQMDCEDEAVNTNVILTLLVENGLLRFHEFSGIAYRNRGWPHMAVTIVEKNTTNRFVVDSWFGNQGEPVHVIAYDLWALGWVPAEE